MPPLRLIALDVEDLAVLSAHLQDAVVRVEDMAFLKVDRRFAALTNRFDWQTALAPQPGEFQRRRAGLRFERVLGARLQGFDLSKRDQCLNVLAISFQPSGGEDGPEGFVTIDFSGGAAVRLEVECIEAELKDLGAAWSTTHKPDHGGSEPPSSN